MNGDNDEERYEELLAKIKMLMDRPVVEPDTPQPRIDMSLFVNNDMFAELEARVAAVEKRNIEQDERLTNNEHRILKLEEMINDPLERIMKCE